ncbi:MAG TPA: hypothetical protein VGF82_01840 [Terracidiphilus sp.]|jgi:hypothetical protein
METRPGTVTAPPPAVAGAGATKTRRKKRNTDDGNVRYFLPKAGSSPAKPELGQEVASEGEALIEAFKSGQSFYALTAWKAVPEVNGSGSPVILKQAVARS